MAYKDFLLRAKRPASLVKFNRALPKNFKLIHKPEDEWVEMEGVNLDPIESLTLKEAIRDGDGDITTPAVMSSAIHYNLRVTDAWSGYEGLVIEDNDPDSEDDTLDKSKLKRWFKNNGVERLDTAAKHPRSGRTMRWFRWTGGTEWLDITIDEPQQRRRVWL